MDVTNRTREAYGSMSRIILIGCAGYNDKEKNEGVVSTADDKTIIYETKIHVIIFLHKNCFSYSYIYSVNAC